MDMSLIMQNIPIFLFIFAAVMSVVGIVISIVSKKKSSNRIYKSTKTRKNQNDRYGYLYLFYSGTPIINKIYNRIRETIRLTYPADDMSVDKKAVKQTTLEAVILIACVVFVIYSGKGDWFYILFGILTSIVIANQIGVTRFRAANKKILEQTMTLIDTTITKYCDTGTGTRSLDDAIELAIEDIPYEISLHTQNIYSMLTQLDIASATDDYIEMAPNKYIASFAAIASLVMENGDEKNKNGTSLLVDNLNYLKQEIQLELLKVKQLDFNFSLFNFICLLPVLFIKWIENWAIKNVDEMASYYSGSFGIKSMAIIFVGTIICYLLLSSLRTDAKDYKTERQNIWYRLSKREPFNTFINLQENINYSRKKRIDDDLRITGSSLQFHSFQMQRLVLGVITAVAMFGILGMSCIKDINENVNNFKTEYDSSFVPDENYSNTMRQVSAEIAKDTSIKDAHTDKDIAEIARSQYNIESSYADMIGTVVSKRIDNSVNLGWKWFFTLYVLGGFIIGYSIPVLMLKYRYSSINLELEDEVAQFRTIIIMLMHIQSMNSELILEWMDRFAVCFKPGIEDCLLEIAQGERGALAKLYDNEPFQPFQELVTCMMAIDTNGVAEAFSQIEIRQKTSMSTREVDNNHLIKKKTSKGKILSAIPTVLVFGGYLIVPWTLSGIKMMSTLQSSMNGG